jgi:hypothetical protein
MSATTVLFACFLVLLANIAVLGLTLKLYTEYFKDRSQLVRRGASEGEASTSTRRNAATPEAP